MYVNIFVNVSDNHFFASSCSCAHCPVIIMNEYCPGVQTQSIYTRQRFNAFITMVSVSQLYMLETEVRHQRHVRTKNKLDSTHISMNPVPKSRDCLIVISSAVFKRYRTG